MSCFYYQKEILHFGNSLVDIGNMLEPEGPLDYRLSASENSLFGFGPFWMLYAEEYT